MNMKNMIIAAVIVGICLVAARYAIIDTSRKKNTQTNRLIVGTASGYAPFVSINANGEYEGFDIDIANALAKQLDKELVIKDLGSLPTLFCALEQGSIDVIIWALSITQERQQAVAMVRYQGEGVRSYPLIFWQQVPTPVTSFADCAGLTVCVEPRSTQEKVLNKYPTISKKPVDKVTDSLLELQYGKADAALVEPAIAKTLQASFPAQLIIVDIPLQPSEQEFGNGIAIRKDNRALIAAIEQAVENLRANGTIAQLEQKWGLV